VNSNPEQKQEPNDKERKIQDKTIPKASTTHD